MEETDVVTDQRCRPELGVSFNVDHGDRVVQDHGVESVEGIRGKTVQTDGNSGDNGSHVQGVFGRRLKTRGLIYPGNNPERIMPTGSGGVARKWKRHWSENRRSNGFFYRNRHVVITRLGMGGSIDQDAN